MAKAKQPDPLAPSAGLLCKLGSLAVHVDEFFSPHGHEVDKTAITQLLIDPEVVAWVYAMSKLAMLPVKRNL